jgi:2-methylcitrate dehydratase
MKLDEDRMANAISLALIPHIELNKGQGAMSMWKNVRESEPVKCGVWGALQAREGLTGNPQPFEGRGAYWSYQKRAEVPQFTLPKRPDAMVIEWDHWFKRRPAEAGSQGILMMMPEVRAWVKPDEIASIHFDMGDWEEIGDNPKWDPRNRQTADHSLPYIIARSLIDGDIYLDSYDEAKFMDPAARALMNKTTLAQVLGWSGNGQGRLTITKTSGETKFFDTFNGVRALTMKEYEPMGDAEVKAKFDRVCAFRNVAPTQRDQAYKVWSNLGTLKDFADAMKVMAKFGQPKPL